MRVVFQAIMCTRVCGLRSWEKYCSERQKVVMSRITYAVAVQQRNTVVRHVLMNNFSSLLAISLYNLPQDLGFCSAVSASCLQLLL